MRFELQYVQMRPASYDPKMNIGERKTHIIEAESREVAEQVADTFLAGRAQISLHSLYLPSPIIGPNPKFLPLDEYV